MVGSTIWWLPSVTLLQPPKPPRQTCYPEGEALWGDFWCSPFLNPGNNPLHALGRLSSGWQPLLLEAVCRPTPQPSSLVSVSARTSGLSRGCSAYDLREWSLTTAGAYQNPSLGFFLLLLGIRTVLWGSEAGTTVNWELLDVREDEKKG